MTALPILRPYQTADRRRDRGERPRYGAAQRNPPDHVPHDWEEMTFDEPWRLFNRECPTPQTTIEALMFGLRDGLAALANNPDRLRRLSELSAEQLKAVCRRLQNFNQEIATPWSSDQVTALIAKWRGLHAR
jgi:hypothetical protein